MRTTSKYRNVWTVYKGRKYQSKAEANHAAHLDLMKSARGPEKVKRWKPQVRVPLKVNGKLVCTYVLDFHVHYEDGREEWHEVKGVMTDAARIKIALFRAIYPDRALFIAR